MKVKPLNCKKVYDPMRGTYMPENGSNIELDNYWSRRIAKGDVEIIHVSNSNQKIKEVNNDN